MTVKYFRVFAFAILMLTVFCGFASSQTPPKQKNTRKDVAKYHITPTKSNASPTGLYIPKDLPDTFVELDKMLTPALRAEMKKSKDDNMSGYHMGLGMWMRNNWGLWKGLRLAKWFNQQGIFHPDDMSGIILTSYWRHLNRKPIGLQAQVKFYQNYWKQERIKEAKEKQRVKKAKATISRNKS